MPKLLQETGMFLELFRHFLHNRSISRLAHDNEHTHDIISGQCAGTIPYPRADIAGRLTITYRHDIVRPSTISCDPAISCPAPATTHFPVKSAPYDRVAESNSEIARSAEISTNAYSTSSTHPLSHPSSSMTP